MASSVSRLFNYYQSLTARQAEINRLVFLRVLSGCSTICEDYVKPALFLLSIFKTYILWRAQEPNTKFFSTRFTKVLAWDTGRFPYISMVALVSLWSISHLLQKFVQKLDLIPKLELLTFKLNLMSGMKLQKVINMGERASPSNPFRNLDPLNRCDPPKDYVFGTSTYTLYPFKMEACSDYIYQHVESVLSQQSTKALENFPFIDLLAQALQFHSPRFEVNTSSGTPDPTDSCMPIIDLNVIFQKPYDSRLQAAAKFDFSFAFIYKLAILKGLPNTPKKFQDINFQLKRITFSTSEAPEVHLSLEDRGSGNISINIHRRSNCPLSLEDTWKLIPQGLKDITRLFFVFAYPKDAEPSSSQWSAFMSQIGCSNLIHKIAKCEETPSR